MAKKTKKEIKDADTLSFETQVRNGEEIIKRFKSDHAKQLEVMENELEVTKVRLEAMKGLKI